MLSAITDAIIILYYTILYYTILYCTILHYTTLYYIILNCIIILYIILYFSACSVINDDSFHHINVVCSSTDCLQRVINLRVVASDSHIYRMVVQHDGT